MAQRVEVLLVDDVDGSAATEQVTFALDGVSYEIDVSEKNAKALREDFAKWAGVARRTGMSGTKRRPQMNRRSDLAAVREWARSHGFEVSDRGRIPRAAQAAYDKAN